jgi:hypothetical protein
MPWTAIPVGHLTDLPPAVIPIDSIIFAPNLVMPGLTWHLHATNYAFFPGKRGIAYIAM